MSEVTLILQKIETGDCSGTTELLPLIYDELRRLASARLAGEKPGQTLQATALVHEAWCKLVDTTKASKWKSREHFFAAAAEAMRRILVDRARARQRQKRGGDWNRIDVELGNVADESEPELIIGVHEALDDLESEDEQLATLVKLRCFGGFSLSEAADLLQIGQSTAYEHWAYAKARLRILLEQAGRTNR